MCRVLPGEKMPSIKDCPIEQFNTELITAHFMIETVNESDGTNA
jgi:hypothetical protein